MTWSVVEHGGKLIALNDENGDTREVSVSAPVAVDRAKALRNRVDAIKAELRTSEARKVVERFQARCGPFGGVEHRIIPVEVERASTSGDPDGGYYVKGHAAVYNRLSLNLGGFQEKIDKGAFTPVLDRNPDVHLNWDHDMRYALARTMSTKYLLELREDPRGLHYYAKVAPTSYANDLRVLMEGSVIDQASFAFTVADDSWEIKNMDEPDELVIRTIHEIGDLFDVTITAQGAYPQTDSAVVRSYAMGYAVDTDRIHVEVEGSEAEDEARMATPEADASSQDEVVVEDEVEGVEEVDAEAESDDNDDDLGAAPSQDIHVEGDDQRSSTAKANAKARDLRFRLQQSVDRQRHNME
jgi:HK97 family phage prohead protease